MILMCLINLPGAGLSNNWDNTQPHHFEWNPFSQGIDHSGPTQPMASHVPFGLMMGSRGGGGLDIGLYKCPKCDKTYERKISLNRHLNLECGKEPQFACPLCPHRTKHKHNLICHIRTRHRELDWSSFCSVVFQCSIDMTLFTTLSWCNRRGVLLVERKFWPFTNVRLERGNSDPLPTLVESVHLLC